MSRRQREPPREALVGGERHERERAEDQQARGEQCSRPARPSLSPSLRERVRERRTHPRSESACEDSPARVDSRAQARRRAARCRSASDSRSSLRQRRHIIGCRLEVADEQHRARSPLRRARASLFASWSADEICVPARNVPVHGFTGGPSRGGTSSRSIGRSCRRRRSGRKQLVRDVREDDEPDARVLLDQAMKYASQRVVVVVGDRERKVDRPHPRATGKKAALLRLEVAREHAAAATRRTAASAEGDPEDPSAPGRGRERADIVCVDSGHSSERYPGAHLVPRPSPFSLATCVSSTAERTRAARSDVSSMGGAILRPRKPPGRIRKIVDRPRRRSRAPRQRARGHGAAPRLRHAARTAPEGRAPARAD